MNSFVRILPVAAAVLLAVQPSLGDLLVGSYNGNQILRFNETTGAFLGVFASGGGLDGPTAMTFGPDGNLYVASFQNDRILRYNGITGAFMGEFVTAGLGRLTRPVGMAFGRDGKLYVTSTGWDEGLTGHVLRYEGTTGDFIDLFIGGRNGASDLAFGPDGYLYVRHRHPLYEVRRYDANGWPLASVRVPDGEVIVFGLDSKFYLNVYYASPDVLRCSADTMAPPEIFINAGSGGLGVAGGLLFGPDGKLYVSSGADNNVRRYDGITGAFIDVFIPSGSGGLNSPFKMLFTPPISVVIDIKPRSLPNSINLQSWGSIPVAILSSASFHAPAQVDKASLKFGRTGNESSLAFCNASPEDVNSDARRDQVCHFYTQQTAFQAGDTVGVLTGKTVSGTPIRGTDSVRIVP
ncbi:MAG: hypothetical protein AAB225_02160 [Acidobacteriota bacterium]